MTARLGGRGGALVTLSSTAKFNEAVLDCRLKPSFGTQVPASPLLGHRRAFRKKGSKHFDIGRGA
eukprot:6495541-Alexandrium_andersonii.AAC.1